MSFPARLASVEHEKQSMPRILVVDDISGFRSLIKMTLLRHGFEHIDEACDGIAALAKLRTSHYALMICDLLMPRLDGFGLVQLLRSSDTLRDLPVLIVTGDAERESIIQAIDLGVSGYLTKPFKPGTLIDAVYSALGDRVRFVNPLPV